MSESINLAFLWHMHQPVYIDPLKKEFTMPWVRLHAMQDYLDIPEAILKVKGAKSNINFVPSLLMQIEYYIERRYTDSYLSAVEKDAKELSDFEKNFIVDKLFNINLEKVVFKSERYKELYLKKDELVKKGKNNIGLEFFEQELRDLQVLFQLHWSGTKLKQNKFIKELIYKDRNFTEEEKNKLLNIQYEFLKEVRDYIKNLALNENVEISLTPFYHPIIPIMNDINNVKLSWPSSIVPNNFSDMSLYSVMQIEKTLNFSSKFFGNVMKGMWPAEGSVSRDFIRQLKETPVKWIATDVEILNKTFRKQVNYDEFSKPYDYEGIKIFFRNHSLSDKIGFVYSNWNENDAVNDFIAELERLKNLINVKSPLIVVILDGENAWEYYDNHGETFLTLLFERLVGTEWINLTTFGEYLENNKDLPKLNDLIPGSWIDGNFNTWINEPVKNKYWEYLFHVNGIIEDKKKNGFDKNKLKETEDYFLVAQGSDWMWWAGEGHSSANDLDFDLLFRNYLIKLYELLDLQPPSELLKPLYSKNVEVITYKKPLHLISPKITGKLDDYYGWVSSGEIFPEQGAIHKSEVIMKKVLFGFDYDNLYFQIQLFEDISVFKNKNYVFCIDFVNYEIRVDLISDGDNVVAFIDEVCEASVKFKKINENFKEGDIIKFRVLLKDGENIIERLPNTGVITIEYPGIDFDLTNWSV